MILASLSLLRAMEKGNVIIWCKKTFHYEFLGCVIKNHTVRDLIFEVPSDIIMVADDETQSIYAISKYGKEKINAL